MPALPSRRSMRRRHRKISPFSKSCMPMRYIDEYRDSALARGLLESISREAGKIRRPLTLMEICGSHTHALSRFGIRRLLPERIRLISGPGCPVCITSAQDVDTALYLALQDGVLFATFA